MYRFDADESIPSAIRRIAVEELDGALGCLGGADRPLALRVHETRKHVKRVRALLLLASGSIDDDVSADIRRSVRDAAHRLAGLRSRTALADAFNALIKRHPETLNESETEQVRSSLLRGPAGEVDGGEPIALAMRCIEHARARAPQLELRDHGWAVIELGFLKTYRAGRRAFAHAKQENSIEAWHGFRTPAKRHFYQVQLLEPAWEGPLRALRLELSELGDVLGQHHDLSLLDEELDRYPELHAHAPRLHAAISKRIRRQERDARELGARLFCEKPRQIARRFCSYFDAWRA